MLCGCNQQQNLASRDRIPILRCADCVAQLIAGKKGLVFVILVDLIDNVGLAGP